MGAPLGSEHVAVLLNQFTGLWPESNVMSMQQLSSTADTLQRRLHEKENACKTKPLRRKITLVKNRETTVEVQELFCEHNTLQVQAQGSQVLSR